MKKLLALLLVVALALPMSLGLFAAAAEEVELPVHPNGRVVIDGAAAEVLDPTPLSIKGVTYLPVKAIAEKVNAEEVKLASEVVYGEVAYAPAKDVAAAFGLYYYEKKLNDLVYLFTDAAVAKDGAYTVWSSADSRGYAAVMTVTVKDGKVTAATFDEQNINTGELKYADGNYTANWKSRYPDVDPDALKDKALAELVEKQAPSAVDVTTGATSTHAKIVELSTKALAKAKFDQLNPAGTKGYRDGKYEAVGLADTRGYTPVLKMTVAAGIITSVEYDEVNAEGVGKVGTDYTARWAANYNVVPEALLAQMKANLIKQQDPSLVDVVSGATGWYNNFTDLAAGVLDHAARTEETDYTPVDGLYYVKGATDSRGYTPLLMAVIEDGAITQVKYHEINKSFVSKRNDADYIGRWTTSYPEAKPLEALAAMEAAILENNSFDAVDAISGATSWKNNIQKLGKDIAVKSAAETTYFFRAKSTASSCYKAQMIVEVDADGEIAAMGYKEYQNSSALPKIDNPAYISRWAERVAETFPNLDQIAVYNEMMTTLFETKDTSKLDTISGASNWRKGIVEAGDRAFEWIK